MIYININKVQKKKFRIKQSPNYNCNSKIRGYMSNATQPDLLNSITLTQYHKFTLVKFKVSAGSPLASQSNINAIIGPYGVNIMNLQKKLDVLNHIFTKGTIVPIFLKIYDFDKYHIFIKTPSLAYLLRDLDSNFISVFQVYELVKKKKKDHYFTHLSEKSLYFSILGYLKSSEKSIFKSSQKELFMEKQNT